MGLNKYQLALALNLRNVLRFQAHRLVHKQCVDQHSFRATILYHHFGGKEPMAMLTHDLEEAITGDLPSPIKKYLTGLNLFESIRIPFTDSKEEKLSKLCDKLELVLDLREQLDDNGQLPKKLMNIYEDEYDKVMELGKELGKEKEVKSLIKNVSQPVNLIEFVQFLKGEEK